MSPLYLALWSLIGLSPLAVAMVVIEAKLKPSAGTSLPDGLKPGLAAELAESRADIERIVGPAATEEGRRNRSLLRWLQILDFPFIAGYALLFCALAWFESRLGFAGASLLALASCGTGLAAAVSDVLEDVAILRALDDREVSVRRFGLPKWLFFYLALLGLSPLFFFFSGTGAEHWIAIVIGILFALAGLGGAAAALLRRFRWIQPANLVAFFALLLLLIFLHL